MFSVALRDNVHPPGQPVLSVKPVSQPPGWQGRTRAVVSNRILVLPSHGVSSLSYLPQVWLLEERDVKAVVGRVWRKIASRVKEILSTLFPRRGIT